MANPNSQTLQQYTTDQTSVWIQPEGCGTLPVMIGCLGVESITVPKGEITKIKCISPFEAGKFITQASIRNAPDDVEFPILANVGAQADWLNKLFNESHCPFPFYILFRCKGRKNNFSGYELALRVQDAEIESVDYGALVGRGEVAGIEKTYNLKAGAPDFAEIYKPVISTQTVETDYSLNDLTFCGETQCGGPCGDPVRDCETGYMIGATNTGTGPDLTQSMHDCIGWELQRTGAGAIPTPPFTSLESASSILCSNQTSTQRLITARGTTDATSAAEIAYSDDDGLNWVNVNLPSTTGDFVSGANGLYQRYDGTLWVVSEMGYIFTSEDNGAIWATRESGALTGGDELTAIHYRDNFHALAVGDVGNILVTEDGGEAWYLLDSTPNDIGQVSPTTDKINTVWSVDRNWYIGTDAGELWRTRDLVNWYLIPFSGQLVGSIADIEFVGCSGTLLFNKTGNRGEVLYTINGYDWELLTTPPNSGINSVHMLSATEFYLTGNTHNGHGLVMKGTAYPTT